MFLSISKSISCILLFVLYTSIVFAQILKVPENVNLVNNLEFLLENNEEINNPASLLPDESDFFGISKINLYDPEESELDQSKLFTPSQISSLLAHIEKHGPITCIEELQTIRNFQLDFIRNIKDRITVFPEKKRMQRRPIHHSPRYRHTLILRTQRILEPQKGYQSNGDYTGSPDKIYARYQYHIHHGWKASAVGEKDAGESFTINHSQMGFDFHGGYLSYTGKSWIKQFIFGDFQSNFGQGLTVWTGRSIGKSNDVLQIKKSSPPIRPIASPQENAIFRGFAGSFGLPLGFESTFFFSRKRIDAIKSHELITSLPSSGLHRSINELSRRNKTIRTTIGGRIVRKKTRVQTSFSYILSNLHHAFRKSKNITLTSERHPFESEKLGIDLGYRIGSLSCFGELAFSRNQGSAYLLGFLIVPDEKVMTTFLYRSYSSDFNPLFSAAFGENHLNKNERGIYFSNVIEFSNQWKVSTYLDAFQFEWLQTSSDAPSSGKDVVVQINHNPSRQTEFILRFKQKRKKNNVNEKGKKLNILLPQNTRSHRFQVLHKLNDQWRFMSRVELKKHNSSKESTHDGILLLQDLRFTGQKGSFSMSIRHALFETSHFNSRIYAYENDVLYAFSIPAYIGRGSRYYLLSRIKINRQVTLWLRYAQTYFNDRNEIGSGQEMIQGRSRSEIKFQLRLNF